MEQIKSKKEKRWGMVIDLARCIGCNTCVIACKLNNDLPSDLFWNRVLTIGGNHIDSASGTYPNLSMYFLPMQCMHCDDPPCVKVCPAAASHQREDGIVLIDWSKCIGCHACIMACPYEVMDYANKEPEQIPNLQIVDPRALPEAGNVQQHLRGVVEKCTFCVQRVDRGEKPFCVVTCPSRAMHFGDLNDPNSDVSKLVSTGIAFRLRPECGTRPKVYYLPPGRWHVPPSTAPEEVAVK